MVQALRAAACIMVVVYHTLQANAGERVIEKWPNGSAGVDLFFVISGFVMLASTRRLAARPGAGWVFLQRRALRIIPLYWLLTAIKFIIAARAPGAVPHTHPGAWNLLASLCFIPARDLAGEIRPVLSVGWSLNFEILFYILFAATLAWKVSAWTMTPVLAMAAIAGFFRVAAWPAPLVLANGMVLEFAAGMAIWAVWAREWTRAPVPAARMLAISAALLLTLPLAGPWRFAVWGLPAAAVLLAAISLERCWGALLPPAVLAAGDASYAIYLIHPFVVGVLAFHGVAGAVLAVPMSVAAGLALHGYVDAPFQRYLKRLTRRAEAAM